VTYARRLRFGLPILDEMLQGGLVAERPYLITGPPGSGKSLLAAQFLIQGLKEGDRGLLVALDEPPNEIKANLRPLGAKIEDLDVLDANSDILKMEPTPVMELSTEIRPFRFRDIPAAIRKTPDSGGVEISVHSLQNQLKVTFRRTTYKRLVLDSLTGLKMFTMKDFEEQIAVQSFIRFLTENHVTSLLTMETGPQAQPALERLLTRGEIRLHRERVPSGLERWVSVEKYRGSKHDEGYRKFSIQDSGLYVE